MPTKIFVNPPVKDLDKSMKFFEQLGFNFNPQFTDETAACMVISDDTYAMLLTHAKFEEFTKKEIADANKTTEVMTALGLDSKEAVNTMREGRKGGRQGTSAADGLRLYVRPFLRGSGRPYLGAVLDGLNHVQQNRSDQRSK